MLSIDYNFCCLGEPTNEPDIWHAVVPTELKTVCGLAIADPADKERWVSKLGPRRPCDNCTEIITRRTDAD